MNNGLYIILGGLVLMAIAGYYLLVYRDEHPKCKKPNCR